MYRCLVGKPELTVAISNNKSQHKHDYRQNFIAKLITVYQKLNLLNWKLIKIVEMLFSQ